MLQFIIFHKYFLFAPCFNVKISAFCIYFNFDRLIHCKAANTCLPALIVFLNISLSVTKNLKLGKIGKILYEKGKHFHYSNYKHSQNYFQFEKKLSNLCKIFNRISCKLHNTTKKQD